MHTGHGIPFVLSAPSGTGKTTLAHRLVQEMDGLRFSVSHTTRAPRGKERDGIDYHFVSAAKFSGMVKRGEFLEHAEVFGRRYGTALSELTRAKGTDEDLLLDIDVQGAAQLRKRIPAAVSIFILAPSREKLEQRLRARSQDSDEVIRRRLADAAREIANYSVYDYVIVNEDLNEAAEALKSVVVAARIRRSQVEEKIRPILASFDR